MHLIILRFERSRFGPGLAALQGAAAQPFQIVQPSLASNRPSGRLCHPQRACRLLVLVRSEERSEIPDPLKQRRDLDPLIVASGAVGAGARPGPVMGPLTQPRPSLPKDSAS